MKELDDLFITYDKEGLEIMKFSGIGKLWNAIGALLLLAVIGAGVLYFQFKINVLAPFFTSELAWLNDEGAAALLAKQKRYCNPGLYFDAEVCKTVIHAQAVYVHEKWGGQVPDYAYLANQPVQTDLIPAGDARMNDNPYPNIDRLENQ